MELVFRKIESVDLPMILAWRTMPEVSDYMYTDFEPDMQQQLAWFEQISRDSTRLDWIINANGEDVGLVSIVRINNLNKRCEWAYYLASPSVRGKGVGKSVELNILEYVFKSLNMHKLCCEVFTSNEMVIKIHEKFGSLVEGTRRKHVYKNGEFHDIVEMGILRQNWEQNIQGQIDFPKAKIQIINKDTSQ